MNQTTKIALTIAAAATLSWSSAASAQQPAPPAQLNGTDAPSAYVTAGFGLPTLLHFEAGYYVSRSTSIDLIGALIVLNAMGGVGATQWFSLASGAFDHDLGIGVHGYLNLFDEPFEFESSGERLGVVVDAMLAYAFTLEAGFTLRSQIGLLIYDDSGTRVSPNITVAGGWRF